jgi:hypothetical protein
VECTNLIRQAAVGCYEYGSLGMLRTGYSGDVANRVQWGFSEQGAAGMLRTGYSGDVANRVQWGCCE